jgi:phosphatidylethanolamine/phosphatidyl-N-methylethanolamine N-methyltransferase
MSRAIFAMEALSDFRTVASVAPSSRYLVRAMLRPLPLEKARVVVELGCGTGAMTRALLKQLPADATLLAFEINPRFTRYLKLTVADPRLVLIDNAAETVGQELQQRGFGRADAVLSSLGLAFMPEAERDVFLGDLSSLLSDDGVFTQYHYVHGMQFQNGQLRPFDMTRLLQRHFGSVEKTIVWRNLPPAYVFVCRVPLRHKTHQTPGDTPVNGRSARRLLFQESV